MRHHVNVKAISESLRLACFCRRCLRVVITHVHLWDQREWFWCSFHDIHEIMCLNWRPTTIGQFDICSECVCARINEQQTYLLCANSSVFLFCFMFFEFSARDMAKNAEKERRQEPTRLSRTDIAYKIWFVRFDMKTDGLATSHRSNQKPRTYKADALLLEWQTVDGRVSCDILSFSHTLHIHSFKLNAVSVLLLLLFLYERLSLPRQCVWVNFRLDATQNANCNILSWIQTMPPLWCSLNRSRLYGRHGTPIRLKGSA